MFCRCQVCLSRVVFSGHSLAVCFKMSMVQDKGSYMVATIVMTIMSFLRHKVSE